MMTRNGPRMASAASGAAWYALSVRSNHERRAFEHLEAHSIPAFLPLYRVASRRRDRRVVIDKPLFGGYLFVQSSLHRSERIVIMRAPGAVRLVGSEGPESIADE